MGLNADYKDMAFTMSLIQWLVQEDPTLAKRLLLKARGRVLESESPGEAQDWRIFVHVMEETLLHPDRR